MTKVVVVDYGIVNLKNIVRGLQYVGAQVESSKHPDVVIKADRLLLPGVGAFAAGMKELRAMGLDEAIIEFAQTGRPLMGICLGMQMLLDISSEYGDHAGLGLIPGKVVPIPTLTNGQLLRKIPHIGWNALQCPSDYSAWNNSCLGRTPEGTSCYFLHSFMAIPKNKNQLLAQCFYQEIPVTAAIRNENVTGLQFHPERSGPAGLNILQRFLEF